MKAKQNLQKLGFLVVFGCFFVPILILALIRMNSSQFSILSLQISMETFEPSLMLKDANTMNRTGLDKEPMNLHLRVTENNGNKSVTAGFKRKDRIVVNATVNQELYGNSTVIDHKEVDVHINVTNENTMPNLVSNSDSKINITSQTEKQILENQALSNTEKSKGTNTEITSNKSEDIQKEQSEQHKKIEGYNALQQSKLDCDLSSPRSDTCSLQGDIRILPNTSTIILHSSSKNSTVKIRPYARKWEATVMQQIKEITVTPSSNEKPLPICSVNHSIPAVIFSTGGFLGNLFHDFTDVLVPLFATSYQYKGEVQFIVTDINNKWLQKYKLILNKLSNYEVISMDSDTNVHCYPKAHLGLLSHKVLGIDQSKTPNGYSMLDFMEFIRSCYGLNRKTTTVIPKGSKKKPRLLMILRKGSRSLMNEKKVMAMARSVGYKVVTAGPEETKDIVKFSKVVNSCDAMMGVHGAGLANMVFLPRNASLIQIVPWGGLKWACWSDFGEPTSNMGLNYVEYEIKEEESSLIEEYPRDHAVFTDPMSIHRQGWNMLWSIFLDKQKVKLDVVRFRGVLLGIYQTLKR